MRATRPFCPSPESRRRPAPATGLALLFLLLSLNAAVPAVVAAPLRLGHALPLDASVATRFRADGGLVAVVHVSVPNRHLVFKREDGVFTSTLQVSVVAEAGGERVGGGFASVTATAADYAATRSDEELLCAVDVPVPPDRRIVLKMTARVAGTSRRWEHELRYDARAAEVVPYHFTGFSWNLEGGSERERVLGGEIDTLAVILTLAAHPAPRDGGLADLLLLVRNTQDQEIVLETLRLPPATGDSLVHRARFASERLPFGQLEFGARIRSVDGEALDLTPGRSFVNLSLAFGDNEAWIRHVSWLVGVADDQARRTLSNTSPAGRRAAWRALWDGRPPDARPAEREHLMRIVEADDLFGRFGRGALSDQGRVYVEHGPPDRTETTEPDLSYPGAWQIWYYRAVGLAYRFYDAYGLGDYRLYDTVPY